jgi:hypothetical protein
LRVWNKTIFKPIFPCIACLNIILIIKKWQKDILAFVRGLWDLTVERLDD